MHSRKLLQPYEEIQGRLTELVEESDALIATIGQFEIRIPLELKSKLEPILGRKIALLRTDLSPQDFRCRLSKNSYGGSAR